MILLSLSRWIRWFRGPSVPPRRRAVFLERLEDRCVTSVTVGEFVGPSQLPALVGQHTQQVDQAITGVLVTFEGSNQDPTPDDFWLDLPLPPGDVASGLIPDFQEDGGAPFPDDSALTEDSPLLSAQGSESPAKPNPAEYQLEFGSEPPTTAPALTSLGVLSSPKSEIIVPETIRLGRSDSASTQYLVSLRNPPSTLNDLPYRLTTFSSAGTVSQDGMIRLSPGVSQLEIPASRTLPSSASPEVVTLTLVQGDTNSTPITLFLKDGTQCSDTALLEAFRKGHSPEAFNALVERNQDTVLRTCHKILGNRHDAEDVSQGVFLTLAQTPLHLNTTLGNWLVVVARNASIAFLRSRNRRLRHERTAAKPLHAPTEDPSSDLREELEAALSCISTPLQQAVRLRYLEGLSQQEASQQLGCPRGTLSQRASLGLRSLRALLTNRQNPSREIA